MIFPWSKEYSAKPLKTEPHGLQRLHLGTFTSAVIVLLWFPKPKSWDGHLSSLKLNAHAINSQHWQSVTVPNTKTSARKLVHCKQIQLHSPLLHFVREDFIRACFFDWTLTPWQSGESRCILEEPVDWADGFVVVYTISDRTSFLNAKNILAQIKESRRETCKGWVRVSPVTLWPLSDADWNRRMEL